MLPQNSLFCATGLCRYGNGSIVAISPAVYCQSLSGNGRDVVILANTVHKEGLLRILDNILGESVNEFYLAIQSWMT